MPSLAFRTAEQTKTREALECILLVEAKPAYAAKILEALGSATDQSYCMEWAMDLSSGIKRLCDGGVGEPCCLTGRGAIAMAPETFDKLHQAVPRRF